MATTLYINKYETIAVAETRSTGIGWTSVGDIVWVADVIVDLVVGDTRGITTVSDLIDASDVPTVSIVVHGYLTELLPVRTLDALGNQTADTGVLTKIPVRGLEAQGSASLSENIPTRTCSATVEFTYAVTLAGTMPGRTLTGIMGAEQVSAKIPVRTISAEIYPGTVVLSKYIPVRSISAEMSKFDVSELDGKIPVRLLTASGHTDYVIYLTGRRPPWRISGSVGQDYSATLSGLIPPRTISGTEYDGRVALNSYIPPRLGAFIAESGGNTGSGGVGTVTPTVADDYILQYVRPSGN